MTTIKASCPTCGEVELTPADVALMVCSHAPLSYYAFCCPTCSEEVRKPADDHVVSLLVSGGVPAQVWELPAEALEHRGGPAITYDDLLVTLALGPSAAWVADYHPCESVTECPDGSLVVRLRARDTAWVRRLVLRLGDAGRVIAPESVAQAVRDDAALALAAYAP